MKIKWTHAAAGVLTLLALTLLTYWPAVSQGYIWDDPSWVFLRPSLRTLEGLQRIWLEPGVVQQYYPLTFTAFWAECLLWGEQLQYYHLVNIVVHGLAAVTLWLVLLRLRLPGAWIVAALFALHPMQVESVAWIVELKTLLSGLFAFASALAYIYFRAADLGPGDTPKERKEFMLGRYGWTFYWLALIGFFLSMTAKTMSVTLPVALCVVVWWREGRLRRDDWLALVPFFMIAAVFSVATIIFESRFTTARPGEISFSLAERLVISGRVFWFYLGKILWPVPLAPVYPMFKIDATAWWQYLPVAAAVALPVALLALRRRIGRGPAAAVLFFGVTVAPFLGVVDFALMFYTFVADRFVYLPIVGVLVLCVAGVRRLTARLGDWSTYVERLFWGLVLLVLGIMSWWQTGIYEDALDYWLTAVRYNPNEVIVLNNLGTEMMERNRYEEAIGYLERGVEVRPDWDSAWANLGLAYFRTGEVEKAIYALERSIKAEPDNYPAWNQLGDIYRHLGETEKAISMHREALRRQPTNTRAWQSLAWILATNPDPRYRDGRKALRFARRALRVSELKYPPVVDTLAAAHAELGQYEQAVALARQAAAIARSMQKPGVARQVEARLRLYRSGQPYREVPGSRVY